MFEFRNLLGSEVEPFIKEGSVKIIDTAKEIYVKLPNWGDVKISLHNQEVFKTKLVQGKLSYKRKFKRPFKKSNIPSNKSLKRITRFKKNNDVYIYDKEKITVQYPVTTIKVKVVPNDNSGYSKYYFMPLCWQPMESLDTNVWQFVDILRFFKKHNSINELDYDKEAMYWDLLGGGGV